MFSIWVPAFLKWELHHAVNVWKFKEKQLNIDMFCFDYLYTLDIIFVYNLYMVL